ncbi:MAG TPA: coenzyme F420-0:L-glutamate ligase, partial [Chloroflexi bacterium]|nr:coenzyme F420-0:L-glutamate ligase [Chloroflexota bacterium]
MPSEIRLYGLDGIPEVRPGDDLNAIIGDALEASNLTPLDGDVLV